MYLNNQRKENSIKKMFRYCRKKSLFSIGDASFFLTNVIAEMFFHMS